MSELRYRAVLEVLDGATVTSVARRFGVSRGTVHVWLGRFNLANAIFDYIEIFHTRHSQLSYSTPDRARVALNHTSIPA